MYDTEGTRTNLFPIPDLAPEEQTEPDEQTELSEDQTPVVTPPTHPGAPRARRTRTPKEACRPITELRAADPKKMNNTELQLLLMAIAEENARLLASLNEATTTAGKAFEQFRQADENFKRLQSSFNAKMAHVEDVVRIAYQSVQMAAGAR